MKITKSGFYKISDIVSPGDKEITIGDNIVVAIFDDLKVSLDFDIGENSKVEIYGYLDGDVFSEINIVQGKVSSSLKCNYLLVSGRGELIKSKIKSNIGSDETISNVKIVSIVLDDGSIDLDGIINIEKNVENANGHLLEENIFIGSKGRIKAIPTLLVKSNNVKASHACKIESISDEKLFYLRSRGLGRDNALSMMIEAKILDLFACLTMIDKDFYDDLIEMILKKIN